MRIYQLKRGKPESKTYTKIFISYLRLVYRQSRNTIWVKKLSKLCRNHSSISIQNPRKEVTEKEKARKSEKSRKRAAAKTEKGLKLDEYNEKRRKTKSEGNNSTKMNDVIGDTMPALDQTHDH